MIKISFLAQKTCENDKEISLYSQLKSSHTPHNTQLPKSLNPHAVSLPLCLRHFRPHLLAFNFLLSQTLTVLVCILNVY